MSSAVVFQRPVKAALIALASLLATAAAPPPAPPALVTRLERAAATGDEAAALALARLVAWRALAGDAEAARATLAQAAGGGDAEAALSLGSLYYAGIGLGADREQALRWWQQAADAGNSTAAYNVALLLLEREEDVPRALDFLTRAAERGHALACFALGTRLAERGADRGAAAERLECAARQGYAPAQFNLARLYLGGTPPGPSRERAELWLSAAAATFAPAAAALRALEPASPAVQPASTGNDTTEAHAAPAILPAPAVVHGEDWVRAQPPDTYTLLVATGASEAAMRTMLARHAAGHDSAYFLHRPSAREPYSAIIGAYATRADAARDLATLPPFFQRNAPWIRRFGTLQHELASAAEAPADAP